MKYFLLIAFLVPVALFAQYGNYDDIGGYNDANYYDDGYYYAENPNAPTPTAEELPQVPVKDTAPLPSLFSEVSNTTAAPVPEPPALQELPDLNTISDILNISNTLDDIRNEFTPTELQYTGAEAFMPNQDMQGVWWRYYTQNTSLFNIPGVSEEMLIIETNGKAIWIQNVKTTSTLRARSQRLLNISEYDLFGYTFFVFHYADQDPASQEIRDKQGFFVRSLPEQGYFQMSKSPNFDPENSIYWKRFPSTLTPVTSTNK